MVEKKLAWKFLEVMSHHSLPPSSTLHAAHAASIVLRCVALPTRVDWMTLLFLFFSRYSKPRVGLRRTLQMCRQRVASRHAPLLLPSPLHWNFMVCSFVCCATRYADLLFVHTCALILRHMLAFPFRPSVHDIRLPPLLRRDPHRLPPLLRRDPRRLPPPLRRDPRRLDLTCDMPTKVQGGECTVGGL